MELIDFQTFSKSCITEIVIPSSVEQIDFYAFKDCLQLSSVKFEDSSNLTSIDYGAFAGTSITDICIPASVTEIGDQAFLDN